MAGQWKEILDTDKLGVADGIAQLDSTGKLKDTQIPTINTGNISGILSESQIPNLDASKITTGSFGADRIPNLNQNKINGLTLALSGKVDTTRMINGIKLDNDITLRTGDLITKESVLPASGNDGDIISFENKLYVWKESK